MRVSLVGVNKIISKKGTECCFLFCYVDFNKDKEPDGVGLKGLNMASFGSDANRIYEKAVKLVNSDCEVAAIYNGGSYLVADISPVK